MKVWQAKTKPVVVIGCSKACGTCIDKNANCSHWAHDGQCDNNPGYMRAMCPASCPSPSQQTGWTLTKAGGVKTPAGGCLDAAGQLPPSGAPVNWLRTAPCNATSTTQQFTYANNTLKSSDGRCLGVQSNWRWRVALFIVC